ncbi:MAG: hypothetical protein ABW321_00760 [Polyangiales bacterium]
MNAVSMPVSASARMILYLGTCVLGAAALAGVWEVLASQAPGSPLYIGMLPAPIERLRSDALWFGVLLWVAGLSAGELTLSRRTRACLWGGSVLVLLGGTYAAATGMTGVQLRDLRPDATWVFIARFGGRLLLSAGLFEIAWRAISARAARARGDA